MNENAEKLGELKDSLANLEREHADILAKEPSIAHPVHQAAAEAARIYRTVTECHAPKEKNGN